jgi:hypothetical protein
VAGSDDFPSNLAMTEQFSEGDRTLRFEREIYLKTEASRERISRPRCQFQLERPVGFRSSIESPFVLNSNSP